MFRVTVCIFSLSFCLMMSAGPVNGLGESTGKQPYLVVLGIAQDGGVPQAGTKDHPGWGNGAFRHLVSCLAIVDSTAAKRWMIDCTPDFKEQLHILDELNPVDKRPGIDGIFLTHAHMGHYTGLMHLGHEVMGTKGVPVHAMPRMLTFLSENGPWSQLVNYNNITLEPLSNGVAVELSPHLIIEPFLVPHRQEYSEVIGYLITEPHRSVLYISDIDSWDDWDDQGKHIEELIPKVDVAYLDGTFYSDGEIPGRDMSTFPHPLITSSMHRFKSLPAEDRIKVRFIHLNHTNPALIPGSEARKTIENNGFRVAEELERVDL
ncbi:MAG: MBL fold metallo-hydrolase [Candidatus Latescibacteria bacterium]|nr:MBL fold metallo-hydrolase [Candidatus Latescibacterota bacterium]NIO56297.1 MBL fold metallo-hydrolase [Candidatus Latescibacterota bacterium]